MEQEYVLKSDFEGLLTKALAANDHWYAESQRLLKMWADAQHEANAAKIHRLSLLAIVFTVGVLVGFAVAFIVQKGAAS